MPERAKLRASVPAIAVALQLAWACGCATTASRDVASSVEPRSGANASATFPGEPAVGRAEAPSSTATPPALRAVPDAVTSLERTRAARSRGLAWMLANQRPDGSFGTFESPRAREIFLDTQASHRAFHTATSALACWALVVPSRTDPAAARALARGLRWLENQGEVGRASGNTFYSVWTHTYLLELAAAVLAEPGLADDHAPWRAILGRELEVARREQSAEGGWAYYDFNHVGQSPSGHESTSFNTAAMIEAALNARDRGASLPPSMLDDAALSLLRMQVPSGAFAYGTYAELNLAADYNKVSGASGRLQACNLALFRTGKGGVDGELLLRGVELLRERHHYIEIARGRVMPHEAYYRNSGYYYFFGHYYCARVLEVAPPGERRDLLARWLAEQMAIDQNRDGSWFDYPLYGYGFAYATGFAMRTLEILEPLLEAQVAGAGAAPAEAAPAPMRDR